MSHCPSCQHVNPAEAQRCGFCGASLSEAPSTDLDKQVLDLLADGRKIEAIKVYREATGAGLKEAKDAVEAIERGKVSVAPGDLESAIVSLLQEGQKIQAVKLYRERIPAGLKEAKDAVEKIARQHGLPVAQGRGCLGVVVSALIVLVGRFL